MSLLTLASLLQLMACSNDPVPADGPTTLQVPISFRNTELKAQQNTRVNLEDKGVYDFYVWGYKTTTYDDANKTYGGLQTIMDRYKVQWTQNTAGTTTSNVADWEYVGITDHGQTQNIKYWDMDATSYRFFGIAPCSATDITYAPTADNTEYDFTFRADAANWENAPYISKLWITNNNPTDFPNHHYLDVVTLEFMKPVTKVRIILVDELGKTIHDPASAGVTDLEFAPTGGEKIIQSGNLKVTYPMQGSITFTQYLPMLTIVGDDTGAMVMEWDPEKDDDYADWYYVLPHIVQNPFQLKLTVYDKPKMATVPSELMSWNPNMEYTYKFKLTATDVQFIDIVQVGVTTWTVEPSQHPVYNW